MHQRRGEPSPTAPRTFSPPSTHHKNIGNQTSNPIGRWGWDFLVLQDTWFQWTTDGRKRPERPGSVQVYVQHITDDGYAKPGDGTEPDPRDFRPVEDSDTWLDVYAYALVRGSCESSWRAIEGHFEREYDWQEFYSGRIVELPSDGLEAPSPDLLIRYIGWRVSMTDLGTERAVRERLLTPVAEGLDRLVASPG